MKEKPSAHNQHGKAAAANGPRIMTSDVAALLELAARLQRDNSRKKTLPGAQDSPFLSAEQVHEWFSREKYVCGEEIAEGGMARIYCAADLHLCRTVALKTLLDSKSPETISRFVYEAQITAQLQHPNIVTIYDAGIDKGTGFPFFTMELISGRSLLDIILGLRDHEQAVEKFRNISDRLSVFQKACDALAFAHSHQVVHQDVKPGNIMVGEYGQVYVIDWGIAQSSGKRPEPDPKTGRVGFIPSRLTSFHDVYGLNDTTNRSTFMGSPVHMAPEQFVNEEVVDARADIYGLGCTLFELTTLHTPFDGSLPAEELLAVKKRGDFRKAWDYNPELRHGLAEIIHKCLAPNVRNRYQTVPELQHDIAAYVQHRLQVDMPGKIYELQKLVAGIPAGEISAKARGELLDCLQRLENSTRFERGAAHGKREQTPG